MILRFYLTSGYYVKSLQLCAYSFHRFDFSQQCRPEALLRVFARRNFPRDCRYLFARQFLYCFCNATRPDF